MIIIVMEYIYNLFLEIVFIFLLIKVVWAKTYRIGCGFVHRKDSGEKMTVLCNYGPGGNVMGSPMYVRGDAPANCKVSSTYPNLCADHVTDETGSSGSLHLQLSVYLLITILFWIF